MGVGLVVAVAVLLVVTRPDDDDTAGTTTTTAASFTVEAEGGTLTFGGDDETATLDFSGPDADGRFSYDLDGDGIVAEGDGGRFEVTPGEPPGWPADFPVPVGAVAVRGSVTDSGPLVQLSTTYRTEQDPTAVVDGLVDGLAEADPVVERDTADPTRLAVLVSFEGRWTGFLTVARVDDATTVGVQLFQEP